MQNVKVNLGKRTYYIKIGHGILEKAGKYISGLRLGNSGIIITNSKINRLYGDILKRSLAIEGIESRTITVPDSESSKSYKVFSCLISSIAKYDKGKKPFVVAFGGGVVGDLAGFVAASYRRGVPLVEIPTTLVAQVDSSIGGKVAIDLPVAKNLVGAFYQPRIVISDTSLLKSLPEREIRCGLSEIIKYSIIRNRGFFNYLSQNISFLKKLRKSHIEYVTKKCSAIKSEIVSRDEKDTKGVRAILNYGHTVGHAIEAASGYGKRYNHGEAIAAGMVAAAEISKRLGMLPEKEAKKIKNIISEAGLPVKVKGIKGTRIFEALCHDKKFAHGINSFVLPVRIGKVVIVKKIPKKLIVEAIRQITGE